MTQIKTNAIITLLFVACLISTYAAMSTGQRKFLSKSSALETKPELILAKNLATTDYELPYKIKEWIAGLRDDRVKKQAQEFFGMQNIMDTNQNYKVSMDEWFNYLNDKGLLRGYESQEFYKNWFNYFDTDGDNQIQFEEVLEAMKDAIKKMG